MRPIVVGPPAVHSAATAQGGPPSSKGKTASSLGLAAAGFGFSLEVINEFGTDADAASLHAALNSMAFVSALAAIGLFIVAQQTQSRRWSRRTHSRILIGSLFTGLLLVVVLVGVLYPNTHRVPQPAHRENAHTASAAPAQREAAASSARDRATAAAGWYGETQENGLQLALVALDDRSDDSQTFTRLLQKSAPYAALTLINVGHTTPLALASFQVTFRLDSGETLTSWPIDPELARIEDKRDREWAKRLTLPRTLAFGEMLADIPVGLPAHFPWEHVVAAAVKVNGQTFSVSGCVMTTSDRKALQEKTQAVHVVSNAGTNRHESAEAWFKSL
jgi:hypothetical protein